MRHYERDNSSGDQPAKGTGKRGGLGAVGLRRRYNRRWSVFEHTRRAQQDRLVALLPEIGDRNKTRGTVRGFTVHVSLRINIVKSYPSVSINYDHCQPDRPEVPSRSETRVAS